MQYDRRGLQLQNRAAKVAEELHVGTNGLKWNEHGEKTSEFIPLMKVIRGNSQLQNSPIPRRSGGILRGPVFHVNHISFCLKYYLVDLSVLSKFRTYQLHLSESLGEICPHLQLGQPTFQAEMVRHLRPAALGKASPPLQEDRKLKAVRIFQCGDHVKIKGVVIDEQK